MKRIRWAFIFLSLTLTALVSVPSVAQETTKRTVEEVPAVTVPPGDESGLSVAFQGLDEAIRYVQADQINKWNEAEHKAQLAKKKIPKVSHSEVSIGEGRCGGNLPPCWVMNRESGGNINAYNPTGCSGRGCYGKWQCDPNSCNGTGTEAEQDAEAARLWNGGAGCSNWAACG